MNWGVGSLGAAIKQQVFTWPEFHILALCNWGKHSRPFLGIRLLVCYLQALKPAVSHINEQDRNFMLAWF